MDTLANTLTHAAHARLSLPVELSVASETALLTQWHFGSVRRYSVDFDAAPRHSQLSQVWVLPPRHPSPAIYGTRLDPHLDHRAAFFIGDALL